MMLKPWWPVMLLLSVGWTSPARAASPDLTTTARLALSADAAVADPAIATLRASGPKGVTALTRVANSSDLKPGTPTWQQYRHALDQVCQQRDCVASQLYWYTDLASAKAAAQASGKPILSLRLLGQLDEDLTCANSRFFRVVLYPNAAVSKVLRDRFILHWQSVRPVPKVTIDFGDGRRLERTLTGNSIHYILDAQGRPVDALPGLYGPQAFLRQLQQVEPVAKTVSTLPGVERQAAVQRYHRDRLQAMEIAWANDLKRLGLPLTPLAAAVPPAPVTPPTAEVAGQLAVTKAVTETPVLRAIALQPSAPTPRPDAELWTRMATLHAADARLDRPSQELMRQKRQTGALLPRATIAADPLQSVLQNFERFLAEDTVRNEYLLHGQLHQWFIQGQLTAEVNRLNEAVYAQLFLTPSSDRWLGLLTPDTFTAIENEGLRQP